MIAGISLGQDSRVDSPVVDGQDKSRILPRSSSIPSLENLFARDGPRQWTDD